MRLAFKLVRGDDVLGDDHTCEKKRTFWTTRTSRTMSPDDKTASGLIQKSLDVLTVDRSGYLDSMVMPATPASPMFYASAQGDRILSPGRLDPDYPPFPNHGWAVFTGRMPTNGSSWHAGWPVEEGAFELGRFRGARGDSRGSGLLTHEGLATRAMTITLVLC